MIEFLLRFIFSSSKVEFVQSQMNWIDMLAFMPYFLLEIFHIKGVMALDFFRMFKFFRMVRLFRLTKHSKRLKVVTSILASSMQDFKILTMCLLIVILIGGTVVYFTERTDTNATFVSIPDGIWWSVQSVTSVGYGDIIPTTICGRVFSSAFMIFSIITFLIPVLSIVSQFKLMYEINVDTTDFRTD